MKLVCVSGIRGGTGSTTMLAALAHALHRLEQRVLLVDLSSANMLGLHFEQPISRRQGWARTHVESADWRAQAVELQPGLCLLPYGHTSVQERERLALWLRNHPGEWNRRMNRLLAGFDWVLFDSPHDALAQTRSLQPDLSIQVVNADAACHVLLQAQPSRHWLLVNRFDPASRLQQDVLLLWRQQFADRLLPLTMHRDEATAEALAHKLPLGAYAPQSQNAITADSLAAWCMARRERL
ncbi:cellulose synthase [Oceanimonas sp. GK1]|uniref:cellulose biosynthesis protein BcsQ n=1 Tax=Oceanimonas sp. (strain GK1 / IBRC-M 10197) TaxID=511062 RepID=UPI0002494FC2|nr:cellulose biosynthesis protein BcsQ [Oceanimonas sp. GK1]AEY02636.1 cellulose synthase [Oceanimonas sp. GK1]